MEKRRTITLAEIFLAVYYAWYFTPILRNYFSGSYKYLFFAFFAAGAALLLFSYLMAAEGRIGLHWTILVPILCYMALMTLMAVTDYCDASGHIRVSFTFWGTAFIYYLAGYDERVRIRFGKFLICLFALTCITSVIGVYTYEGAARALTNASQRADALETDYILSMRNISSIYLFQMLVVLAPIAVNMVKRRKKTILFCIILIFIVAAVVKAGFTISLILLAFGLVLSLVYGKNNTRILLICGVVLIALFLPWSNILSGLAELLDNRYISTRLLEIAKLLESGTVSGDLGTRSSTYLYSLQTFLRHPFGVGAYYSYRIGENGIGYHSQILDDMARYGLPAVAFYAVFFRQYYRLLREKWAQIDMENVAMPTVILYFAFTLLNIAFRSADESIVILYILPVLPEILKGKPEEPGVSLEVDPSGGSDIGLDANPGAGSAAIDAAAFDTDLECG